MNNNAGRAHRLSPQGTVADYSPVPRAQLDAISPRSKGELDLARVTLLLELSSGQCGSTLWGTWTPRPSRRGPQAFRRSR